MYEVAWTPFGGEAHVGRFRGDRNSRFASERVKAKARILRGEIDSFGIGRAGRDPPGCKSEQSDVPTDEANNSYRTPVSLPFPHPHIKPTLSRGHVCEECAAFIDLGTKAMRSESGKGPEFVNAPVYCT